jgi:hypothetical protein
MHDEPFAETFERIAEHAASAVLYAEIAERYALTGDVVGLRHAAACLASLTKHVLLLTGDLTDLKAKHAPPASS